MKRKTLKRSSSSLYQVSFNHVLGDFVSDNGEFFFGQVFGDFVLHVEVD